MLLPFGGHGPILHETVFVAPGAVLIGQVEAAAHCSFWFNAVVRADNDRISFGEGTNIQDGCILHTDHGVPLEVGEGCVLGHAAVVHACTVGNRVTVGIGARVLNGAVVEDDVVIGAGALVPEGARLESGFLYLGVPARKARPLRPDELDRFRAGAALYVEKARLYSSLLER
ncbi:MAG: gamma carbonic anhydrase family protein [Armatimonadetes bacterium]|nr:gamma carbonic anhydrase family protein [Armatimonadota bacterium]